MVKMRREDDSELSQLLSEKSMIPTKRLKFIQVQFRYLVLQLKLLVS
jgi:hypothetical protein